MHRHLQDRQSALDGAPARPGCTLIEIQLKRSRGDFMLEVRDNAAVDRGNHQKPVLARLLLECYASKSKVGADILADRIEVQ